MSLYDIVTGAPDMIVQALAGLLGIVNGVLGFWGQLGGVPGIVDSGGISGIFSSLLQLLQMSIGI
ncbi:MAG: hypothetical protein GY851_16180 [bacterium]|nr:hypothetical protein [bacterium]